MRKLFLPPAWCLSTVTAIEVAAKLTVIQLFAVCARNYH
jgi:hypothetical protein